MEKKDLEHFKEILLKEKQDILRKAAKTMSEDVMVDPNELSDDNDQASDEYLRFMALRLHDRENKYLNKIEAALKKIEDGEFGICEECGEEISLRRLEARPVTNLCIRCKEDAERQESAYN